MKLLILVGYFSVVIADEINDDFNLVETLVGVSSFIIAGVDVPGFFTRVSKYIHFIAETVFNN